MDIDNNDLITMHVLLIQNQIKKRDTLLGDQLYERVISGILSKNDFITLARIFAEIFKFTMIKIDQEAIKKIVAKFFENHKINVDINNYCSSTGVFYAKLRSTFSNVYRKRKNNNSFKDSTEMTPDREDFEKEIKDIIEKVTNNIYENQNHNLKLENC